MTMIKVSWQADDGYVGKQRPQETSVDISDFIGLSKERAESMLLDVIQDDFLQKVSPECDDFDGAVKEIMDAAALMAGEDAEVRS